MLILESASGENQTMTARPWACRDNQDNLCFQDGSSLEDETKQIPDCKCMENAIVEAYQEVMENHRRLTGMCRWVMWSS